VKHAELGKNGGEIIIERKQTTSGENHISDPGHEKNRRTGPRENEKASRARVRGPTTEAGKSTNLAEESPTKSAIWGGQGGKQLQGKEIG